MFIEGRAFLPLCQPFVRPCPHEALPLNGRVYVLRMLISHGYGVYLAIPRRSG